MSSNLIGTKSKEGISNVAVLIQINHIGSFSSWLLFKPTTFRPTTVIRNTYDNIKKTEVFTIKHIHESILEDALQTSVK